MGRKKFNGNGYFYSDYFFSGALVRAIIVATENEFNSEFLFSFPLSHVPNCKQMNVT